MPTDAVLFVSPDGRKLQGVASALADRGYTVCWAQSVDQARGEIADLGNLSAVVVDSSLDRESADFVSVHGSVARVVSTVRGRSRRDSGRVSVFLALASVSTEVSHLMHPFGISDYFAPDEDGDDFVSGRIHAAVRGDRSPRRPPFYRALREAYEDRTYSWHTPSHSGGAAFLKSDLGRDFVEFYGEQLFRTDVSVSVPRLGSLVEHDGPIGEAERNAARVFGADHTYFVLNGTSTADRIVGQHMLGPGDIAIVDRNCHKAVVHALVLGHARPVFLPPTRNGLGMIGPVPVRNLEREGVRSLVAANPLVHAQEDAHHLAVITNSTYDGVCYDAPWASSLLAQSVACVHFDEAWFGYAHFHPLYQGRYGMAVDAHTLPSADRPAVFASQSTHKMLPALSQSAMLHVRTAPRAPIDPAQLDETFMMHASTSPSYPLLASLDVATGMLDGPAGSELIADSVAEAVSFRQSFIRLRDMFIGQGTDWFFNLWQPPKVTDPETGSRYGFAEAPQELLVTTPSCWTLDPEEDWHGFDGLHPGYCLLDPLKVTVMCPGVQVDGTVDSWGVPASVLAAYLRSRRVLVEKTSGYTVLVLFSLGSTRSKSISLLQTLRDFKELYDRGAPLTEVLPDLVEQYPHRYAELTLPELCSHLHDLYRSTQLTELLDLAFTTLPEPALTPADCYQRVRRQGTDRVPLAKAASRVVATMVVVTPPGIPLLVPGERVGAPDGPVLRYLRALEEYDRMFPGLGTEIHGIIRDPQTGDYSLSCLAE
ncbi:arginine decarboxylase [Lipingzhangella sp. LS1_29]|uniref:Arginine decarboxylase n=1 Tax=Lipingzhangella rawalii TaxID=2055835 RepID=A0ABU2H7S0_9ACTN|nr:arginine decarboxylase [Lipingzhangella rawalii]MDS1271358.1 arginine decarboxylase [Lipingzhangella rawalii]